MLIGRHLSINEINKALDINANIIQIFLGSPRTIQPHKKTIEELNKIKIYLKENKIKNVIHGSYTINLANPIKSFEHIQGINTLVADLNASVILKSLGVIIHMGKNVKKINITNDEALQNYIKGIQTTLEKSDKKSKIILETGASQGTEICSNIEGLKNIFDGLTNEEKKRIGFCIDTCHIWASGYDISNKQKVKDFFKKFDELIGIKYISCIHLNNSKNQLNSHVDRHEMLKTGLIPLEGIDAFIKYSKKLKIPLVLETPLLDYEITKLEIEYVKNL